MGYKLKNKVMISNEKINEIIQDCKKSGYSIRIRDILYVALSNHLEDKLVAYKGLFQDINDYETYTNSIAIKYLTEYLNENNLLSYKSQQEQMTFDENKRAMEELIKRTEDSIDDGKIEEEKGIKIIADIRTKLNNYFKVQEEQKDQLVVVEQKYNDVCPYCGHEIAVPTKEELMKKYDLIER